MKIAITLIMAMFWLHAASLEEIKQEIKKLDIGINEYTIGKELNKKQQEKLKTNPLKANIPSTLKFKDGNLNIVVDEKDKTVLVINENFYNAKREMLKSSIGNLMLTYNEPTTIAHDKILYWLYDREGKMDSTELDLLKQKNREVKSLKSFVTAKESNLSDPIAMVKLSSNQPLSSLSLDNNETSSSKQKDKELNYYIIISSEAMLKHYMP